jgi:sigma-B regulation protein RsbU (phosphoserine phosphatase)
MNVFNNQLQRALARKTPLLASTHAQGVITGLTGEDLQNALASGAKRLLFGQYINEMSRMLPLPSKYDILQLVAEARLLHGNEIAAQIAQTIQRRVQIPEGSGATLRLVLSELLQNAIEHGNLGLQLTRQKQVNEFEWFELYQSTVKNALESPVGRIPVRVSCIEIDNHIQIEIEDRGMGFQVRQTLERTQSPDAPTGRGLNLIFKILNGNLHYTAGGRIVRFSIPLENQQEQNPQHHYQARAQQAKIIVKTASNSRVASLTRTFKSLGCNNLSVVTTEHQLHEDAPESDLIILDGDTANFAPIAYALGNLRRNWRSQKDPHKPILIMSPRAHSAACNLVRQYPAVEVLAHSAPPEELALRLERLLEQNANHSEANAMTMQHLQEMERTRTFQQHMLPKATRISELAKNHRLEVATNFQGCETMAGDYWTLLELSSSKIAFAVVDFTGHGVTAALNTVQLHALLERETEHENPKQVAENLNVHLHHLLGAGSFASYVYGILNTKTGSIEYSCGGAPPMLVRTPAGNIRELTCDGLPLGVAENITVQIRKGQLMKGDTLLIVSDALSEAMHQNGERWGTAGLVKELGRLPVGLGARGLLNQLMDKFHNSAKRPIADDITAVAITWKT